MTKENNNSSSSSSGGTSILGLLGVVFITLKLCGVINWSWWWVTLPFWGGLAIVAIILLGCLVVLGVSALVVYFAQKKLDKERRALANAEKAKEAKQKELEKRLGVRK